MCVDAITLSDIFSPFTAFAVSLAVVIEPSATVALPALSAYIAVETFTSLKYVPLARFLAEPDTAAYPELETSIS